MTTSVNGSSHHLENGKSSSSSSSSSGGGMHHGKFSRYGGGGGSSTTKCVKNSMVSAKVTDYRKVNAFNCTLFYFHIFVQLDV